MALNETLRLIIEGDNRGAVKSIKEVGATSSREFGKSQKSIDKWGQGFRRVGVGMLAIGGAAAIGLGSAAKSASDLGEVVSKTGVVFGQSAGKVEEFAENAVKIGQSKRGALEAASGFGNLFVSMGLATDKSADMSIKLTALASDLASFANTSPEDAILALSSALVGESEPIRRYGVLLDDASLKQKALSMGLVQTTTGVLPPAIRAQAAYALILDQTKTAQGDFARTGDSAANQQRKLTAAFENLKAAIGEGALPVMETLLSVATKVTTGFSGLNDATDGAAGKVATFGAVGLIAVGGLSTLVGAAIQARTNFAALATGLGAIPGRMMGMVVPTVAVEGAFAGATVATSGFAIALGTLSAATGVIAALFALRQVMKSFKDDAPDPKAIASVSKELDRLATSGKVTGSALEDMFDKLANPGDIEGTSKAIDLVDKGLAKLAATDPKAASAAFDHIISKLHEMTGESEKTLRSSDMWGDYNEVIGVTAGIQEKTTGAVKGTGAALDDQTGSTEEATDALKEYEDELKGTFDPLFGMIDAWQDNAEALATVNEKQAAYNKVVAESGPGSKEAAAALQELRDAQLDSGKAGLDATSAMIELNAAVRDNPQLVGDAKQAVAQMARQHIISKSTAAALGRQLDATARDALALGKTDPRVDISTRGIPTARGKIKDLIQLINGIPTHRTITIGVTTALGPQAARLAEAKLLGFASGGRIPGPVGKPRVILAHGGEEVVPLHDPVAMARYRPAPAAMAAHDRGNGGHVQVDVNIVGEGLMRYLRNQVRVEYGGDVQAALGTKR